MMNFGLPLPEGWYPISRFGGGRPTFTHLITAAASVRLSHYFRRSMANNDLLTLLLLPSSFKDPNKKSYRLKEFNFVQWANEFLSEAKCPSCLYFFNEEHIGKENRETTRSSFPETSNKDSIHRRRWTNILLTANVLLFILQIATKGKLMVWGAKVNSLIDKGQFWRLVTPSFLHANIGHLMVNCYSLHSVGPTVESICGPRRFIAVYFTSGVASKSHKPSWVGTAMSYWLSQANSVGASGAIFGLVGSVAVFLVRHRGVIGSSTKDLQYIARVLFLNMMLGLMSRGIDNWGHVGGLLGGAAASWFLGPAWQYNKSTIKDGRRVFIDKAPMYSLLRLRKP